MSGRLTAPAPLFGPLRPPAIRRGPFGVSGPVDASGPLAVGTDGPRTAPAPAPGPPSGGRAVCQGGRLCAGRTATLADSAPCGPRPGPLRPPAAPGLAPAPCGPLAPCAAPGPLAPAPGRPPAPGRAAPGPWPGPGRGPPGPRTESYSQAL